MVKSRYTQKQAKENKNPAEAFTLKKKSSGIFLIYRETTYKEY